MEHVDHRAIQDHLQPSKLQASSSYYRRRSCKKCGLQFDVCSRCDRSQIFCPECKPKQKHARLKKARDFYKKSPQGKKLRAASCQRRRDKIKDNDEQKNLLNSKPLKKFEGDRGSPFPQVTARTPEPALLAEHENNGVFNDVQFPDSIFNSSMHKQQGTPRKAAQIICSFCHRACLPFQRQKKGRLGGQEKKAIRRWRARYWEKDP